VVGAEAALGRSSRHCRPCRASLPNSAIAVGHSRVSCRAGKRRRFEIAGLPLPQTCGQLTSQLVQKRLTGPARPTRENLHSGTAR